MLSKDLEVEVGPRILLPCGVSCKFSGLPLWNAVLPVV